METENATTEVAAETVASTPETLPTEQVCSSHGGDPLPLNDSNFSPLRTGKFSTVCKPCRALKANEWTTRRKDYRKAFHTARRAAQLHKLDVIMPNAKTWQAGDVIMLRDGRTLDSALTEINSARVATREANRLARETAQANEKATKAAAREAKRAEREAAAQAAALVTAENKRLKAEARAAKLAQAETEKAARQAERDEKRAIKQAEVAAAKQASLEAREARKAATAAKQAEALRLRQEAKEQRQAERAAKLAEKAAAKASKPAVVTNVSATPEVAQESTPEVPVVPEVSTPEVAQAATGGGVFNSLKSLLGR